MRFNGINPREISPKVFVSHEVIDAIPPRELRLIATQGGALLSGVDLQEREIHLFLNFAGKSHEHANELASRVAAAFCTDTPAEYEPSHWNGRAFTAILREAGKLEWRFGFGTVEYTFVAPRPFAHALTETVAQTTGNYIRIETRGDVPARPVIKHTFSGEQAALQYEIRGVPFFRLRNPNGTHFLPGAVAEIDFESRKVTFNGDTAMAYVDYTVSDWHPNILGGTNIYSNDGGATEVRWRDEWM